jgi:DHA1 family inner membrane transport protein
VLSAYGIGALTSLGGGWLGDRFSPRLVMSGTFLAAGVLGWFLFSGFPGVAAQATLSLAWGIVASGILYVNLAGYHVKAVSQNLAGAASGVFVTSLYAAAAVSGSSIGWLADQADWGKAGLIQITLLSALGAVLAAFLKTDATTTS